MASKGWATYSLGQLAAPAPDSFVDGPFGSNLKTADYTESGVRIIQLQNIGDGHFSDTNHKYVSLHKAEELARHGAIPGDVIIAKMADPVARACRVPSIAPRWVVVADCMRLRVDESRFDPDFVVQAINSRSVRREAEAKSTGTTRLRITLTATKSLHVRCPPVHEQRRIAAVLQAMDDTVLACQRVLQQVCAVHRRLVEDLLVSGAPGRHHLRPTVLGHVPETWQLVRLGELVRDGPTNGLYRPQTAYGAGVPIVRIDAFDNGDTIATDKLKRLRVTQDEARPFLLAENDILVNRVNSLSHLGKVGFMSALVEPTVFESNMMRLRIDESRCIPRLAFLYLSSSGARRQLLSSAKQAVAQASINQQDVKRVLMPLPPIGEQQQLVDAIDSVRARAERERAALEQRRLLKSELAWELLEQQVRVPGKWESSGGRPTLA